MAVNQKQKELIKIYLVLFALMAIAVNWDSVYWMFNYRAVIGLARNFLSPYPESRIFAANTQKPLAVASAAEPQKAKYPYSQKENSIEIPAINIEAPVVIGGTTQVAALVKDLNKGVVYYPGSVLPGEKGQIIILGHSAPPNWPVKYETVFTEINSLRAGQTVTLHFNHTRYAFKVISKKIIEKGQDLAPAQLNGKNTILTLVSCWPPGKDVKRIQVDAELLTT